MNNLKEKMHISVVGLGLIGGSFCRAIKAHTDHICFGLDVDKKAISLALNENVIDGEITSDGLKKCDLNIICLHPKETIDFILNHIKDFKPGSIVMDVCGVKEIIINSVDKPLYDNGIAFVGTHPMAGNENSGFGASTDTLFNGGSFIITPSKLTLEDKIKTVKKLAVDIKFGEIVLSTPEKHDEIIAYTSQLAHIVSSSYVKSPTLKDEYGFSANSFQDLTRVAKLNEDMWTDLFMLNEKPLLYELNTIISHLTEYRDAISKKDYTTLKSLLKQGRIIKENHLKQK